MREGLCSHPALWWATFDSMRRFEELGTPQRVRDYVALRPTCGSPLIMPPALKRQGPLRQQGLCSHPGDLWATFAFVPYSEALGTPWAQGLCSHPAHLWATADFGPLFEVLGTRLAVGVM